MVSWEMTNAAPVSGSRGRGSTFIEVMIMLMVLTCLVIVFSGSVLMAKRSSKINGQYAQASSLCQHKIDQLRALGYGRLTYSELSDAEVIDATPASQPYGFINDTYMEGTTTPDPNIPLVSPQTFITIAATADPDVSVATVKITWIPAPSRQRNSLQRIVYIANVE